MSVGSADVRRSLRISKMKNSEWDMNGIVNEMKAASLGTYYVTVNPRKLRLGKKAVAFISRGDRLRGSLLIRLLIVVRPSVASDPGRII